MAANKRTLEDIEKIDKEWLTPLDIAGYLECSAYSINLQAQDDPGKLGFPVCVLGTRVKINKSLFLKYFRGELQNVG